MVKNESRDKKRGSRELWGGKQEVELVAQALTNQTRARPQTRPGGLGGGGSLGCEEAPLRQSTGKQQAREKKKGPWQVPSRGSDNVTFWSYMGDTTGSLTASPCSSAATRRQCESLTTMEHRLDLNTRQISAPLYPATSLNLIQNLSNAIGLAVKVRMAKSLQVKSCGMV